MNQAMELLKQRFIEKSERGNKNHETLGGLFGALDGANRERAYHVEDRLKEEKAKAEATFEKNLRKKSGLTSSPYGSEIRQRLYNMPPADRTRAVTEILKSGDGASVAAIVDGPLILTGLKSEEVARIKTQFYRQTAPELLDARETYNELAATVETAITATLKATTDEE